MSYNKNIFQFVITITKKTPQNSSLSNSTSLTICWSDKTWNDPEATFANPTSSPNRTITWSRDCTFPRQDHYTKVGLCYVFRRECPENAHEVKQENAAIIWELYEQKAIQGSNCFSSRACPNLCEASAKGAWPPHLQIWMAKIRVACNANYDGAEGQWGKELVQQGRFLYLWWGRWI